MAAEWKSMYPSKFNIRILEFVLGVALFFAPDRAKASSSVFAAPERLRCEYLYNPEGIGESAPRLSWIDVAADPSARGLIQAEYQILVASSPEKLAMDQGDLWDTGRFMSSKSNQIAYAGVALAPLQACYWKVRVWQPRAADPSPWSQPANWSMGFLTPGEWGADWIGRDIAAGTAAQAISQANWIWFAGENYAAAPSATRWFSRSVTIPAGAVVTSATAWMTADDMFALYVNRRQC